MAEIVVLLVSESFRLDSQLSNKTHIPLEPNSQLKYFQAHLRWVVSWKYMEM